jgi:hypothetical protein
MTITFGEQSWCIWEVLDGVLIETVNIITTIDTADVFQMMREKITLMKEYKYKLINHHNNVC